MGKLTSQASGPELQTPKSCQKEKHNRYGGILFGAPWPASLVYLVSSRQMRKTIS